MEPVRLGCLMLRVALHSHPGHINQGNAEVAEQVSRLSNHQNNVCCMVHEKPADAISVVLNPKILLGGMH